MDELDRGGELQAGVVARARQPGGGHRQQRTQPFSAGGDQMFGQGRDHRHRAVQPLGDQRIDAAHVDLGQSRQGVNRTLGRIDDGLDCIQRLSLLPAPGHVVSTIDPSAIVARDNGGGIGQGQGKHKV